MNGNKSKLTFPLIMCASGRAQGFGKFVPRKALKLNKVKSLAEFSRREGTREGMLVRRRMRRPRKLY